MPRDSAGPSPSDSYVVPPHNIEAEQALLGAILIDNRSYQHCREYLRPEHFFEPVHGRVYLHCARLIEEGGRADPVMLKRIFDDDDALRELNGTEYLIRMAQAADTMVIVAPYAREIHRLAKLRAAIDNARIMVDQLSDPAFAGKPDTLNAARAAIDEVLAGDKDDLKNIADLTDAILNEATNGEPPISTGFREIDDAMGGGLFPGRLYAFNAQSKHFKAQPVSEPVLMADGSWRPIGKLKVGDALASRDGKPSCVVGVYPRGIRKAYRVRLKDGRCAYADLEHLWHVNVDTSEGIAQRVVTTAGLAALLARTPTVWIPRISGDHGLASQLPVAPYTLGALIGDGGLSGNGVRLTTADPEIVERVAAELPAGMKVARWDSINYNLSVGELRRSTFGGAYHPLKAAMRDLGLMGCRSESKFIPEIYFAADRASRVALLQGLMDTDAQAGTCGGSFTTVSPRLASDVQRLAWSLGMVATLAEPRPGYYMVGGERREAQTVHRVQIRADDPQDLFSLPRKLGELTLDRVKGLRLEVMAVEPARDEECVCIKVSHPTNLYVTRDYIVTHNTGVMLSILANAAQDGVRCGWIAAELDREEVGRRLLATVGRFHPAGFKNAGDDVIRDSIEAAKQLGSVTVVGIPSIPFAQLQAKCEALVLQKEVRLIVLDYWQRVRGEPKGERESHLGRVAEWMSAFAEQHKIVFITASQINKRNGQVYYGDGLLRAASWQYTVHKGEIPMVDPTVPGGSLDPIWMTPDVDRHGKVRPIGSKDQPAFYIHPHGPRLVLASPRLDIAA